MGQSVNLSVSGIYTSGNDLNGLPPGALDDAINVESRYRNTLEPRRGFEYLTGSDIAVTKIIRLINFYVSGSDRIIALTDKGDLLYYNGSGWTAIPGSFSTNISPPDSMNAKSRFTVGGQNLYLTAIDGIRSLSSGSSAEMIKAGVPKGLNISGATDGSTSGFFSNNVVLTTTGKVTSGSSIVTNLASITGVTTGMYVSGTHVPAGTTVSTITNEAIVISEAGSAAVGSTSLGSLSSSSGIVAGLIVSGTGIYDGTKVVSVSGGGPYTVVLDTAAYATTSGATYTFTNPPQITMSANATGSSSSEALSFFSGSQVGYRIVYGRVETDINNGTITRLGSPTTIATVTNTTAYTTNVNVTATLPKNASKELTFVQLYRSPQTSSVSITPLDQYNLVYERELNNTDFTNRTITINDTVSDALVGAALYAGSDQEGILQSNDPPPMCWDMCTFRNFALYANATEPTTTKFTILAVGPASGVQINDTITIAGTFNGTSFSRAYTGKASENAANREFAIVTSGTPSQNISDTAASLIRVINYDESCPVHAILLSSTTDLPGQIELEADYPNLDTFTVTASAHTSAYDPALTGITSDVNTANNGVYVSKLGELEAVPATNLLRVGDTSSNIIRVIPLRDYVVVLKADGIYKIQGLTPSSLVVNPFDLTTKIIGPDTAVKLNSGVWMFSNQGVVSISDGGVEAKSIQIDDILNILIGTYLPYVTQYGFAVGYESDRKYILSLPNVANTFTETQYIFNYITNSWTTWNRRLRYGFIHSNEGKLYVSRADSTNSGVSKERKAANYTDYVDEAFSVTITAVSGNNITLSDATGVSVGDILYQSSSIFSAINAVNLTTNVITVDTGTGFTAGSRSVLSAYTCTVTWKQVFGDNPAFVRQFSEGLVLFKNTNFDTATLSFTTDFSPANDDVSITGAGTGLWGLFTWGSIPWGGSTAPSNIRFYVPQNQQFGSFIIPTIEIRQGYSNFKIQGLSLSWQPVSMEVGK